VPNHEDVGCSEHQIRLSKGLIAKFVQCLELEARFAAPSIGDKRKSHRRGGFLCLCFCDWNCVYFKSSKLIDIKWQNFRGAARDGKRHARYLKVDNEGRILREI
jgi:hypothetical protein